MPPKEPLPVQRPMSINVGNLFTVPVQNEADFAPTMKLIEDRLNEDPKLSGEILKANRDREYGAISTSAFQTGEFSPDMRLRYIEQQSAFPLRPGGLDDIGSRFDLARSDLATEKIAKLQEAYPDAEIQFANDVDGNFTILMRRKGEVTGIEVESPDFSQGDLGVLASGIISEDVVAEILAFMATKATGGVRKNMMKAFAAAFVGEGVKSQVERLRGKEQSTPGAIIERMAFTGMGGAAGVLLFDPTARVRNKIRGTRGLVTVSDEAKRGMAASEVLGQTSRLPGSVHPKLRNVQNQAYATSPRMQKAIDDQLAEAAEDLAAFSDIIGNVESLTDKELRNILDKQTRRITSALDSAPNMTWEDAGGKIKKGMDKFFELLAEAEGRDYVKALEATKGGTYDISPVKKLIGLLTFGKRGPVTIKGKGWTLRSTINVTPLKNTDLKSAMKRLNQLDDGIKLTKRPDGEENPLDIMIGLRSQFFSIMEDQAVNSQDRRVAALVHGAMTEAMRNPAGVSAGGVALWRRAANRTRFKEEMLSKDYVRLIANSDSPEKVAKYLANSGNYTAIRDVRRMLTASKQPEKWGAVQEAFKTMLIEGPQQIRSILTGKGTRATNSLDILMPPSEQKVYLEIGDQINRMNTTRVAKMLKTGQDDATRLTGLADKGSRREIRAFLEDVGGKDSPRGRALAAGFIKNLADKATSAGTLKPTFDKQVFADGLHTLRSRMNLDEIFTPDTLKTLELYEESIAFLPDSMGIGDSIQAATIGPQAFSFLTLQPMKALSGGRAFLKNDMIAWLFTTPGARKFMVGSFRPARKPKNLNHARAIGGALGVIAENMIETSNLLERAWEALDEAGVGSLEQ